MVEFLVEKAADVEHLSEAQQSPIMVAAECKRADIVGILIRYGAWLGDRPEKELECWTTMFHASSDGLIEVVDTTILERFSLKRRSTGPSYVHLN